MAETGERWSPERVQAEGSSTARPLRPLVSVIVPGFNEEAVIERNLACLVDYLKSIEDDFRWEIVFVNDGSADATGRLAEEFAKTHANVRVVHHRTNLGLGQALRNGFRSSRGDYIVTLDADLSYAPDHVRSLVDTMRRTGAKLVLASPYMPGGRVSNVPRMRAVLSVWANRFLSMMVKRTVSTVTGMVRAYDGRFIRSMDLRSKGMDINPEIVHKTMLLGGLILEIPGHLNWGLHAGKEVRRRSSMRVLSHTFAVVLSGFLLRPVIFFILPGVLLLIFAVYVNTWMVIHFATEYATLTQYSWFLDRASYAVSAAYQKFPHTFIVGGLSVLISIQLISLGVLSLQSKSYFEEIFHLGARSYARLQRLQEANDSAESGEADEKRLPND
jgi:glycosyltransferase involved in cell wall biosynthesis